MTDWVETITGSDKFPRTLQVVRQGAEKGLHYGAQLCVIAHGERVLDGGLGWAEPGVPMTAETVLPWLSAGKPLTAALIVKAADEGRLALDAPVATYLPEFAAAGKQDVTLAHLLTHTAGLRQVETGWPDVPWSEILRRLCASPLEPDWELGITAGYHPNSSWFVLGEVLARVYGEPYATVIEQQLLRPLGMTHTRCCGSLPDGVPVGWMWERVQGQLTKLDWESGPRTEQPSPGSSFRGPIRALAQFYAALGRAGWSLPLPEGTPVEPWCSAQTVQHLTTRRRVDRFDLTLQHVVDFGWGVIIDSNHHGADTVPYGYGHYASPTTFGHGGSQSSQGYCDPTNGLCVAYVFNGRPGEGQHNRRVRALNDAIYQDLGLG